MNNSVWCYYVSSDWITEARGLLYFGMFWYMIVCLYSSVVWIYIYPTTLTNNSILLLLLFTHFKIFMAHSVGVTFHPLLYRVPRDISKPTWRWGDMNIYLYWFYRPRNLTYCLWVSYIFLPLVIVAMMSVVAVMF